MSAQNHTSAPYPPTDGSCLGPDEVRHRLSDDDARRLGLTGWRRWTVGPAAGTPGRAKLQVVAGVVGGSLQLASQLYNVASGVDTGVWATVVMISGILFYVLALGTYVTYRGNIDHGVYARLDQARREEAARWEETHGRRRQRLRDAAQAQQAPERAAHPPGAGEGGRPA
ncbi:hypothetical protein [Nesterenkonia sp. K-15-9-6]|uniref:hypothetical protein n=1 Tax=Nesterenkonia sp. K-15-9-6 TaxID=3093918 RepID=UPI004043CECA